MSLYSYPLPRLRLLPDARARLIPPGFCVCDMCWTYRTSAIMLRVLLSGPAGSGKRTIAKMLLKKFDQFGYFSAGDFIRDHIQRGTEFGQRALPFLRKGELIPDSILNGILLDEVRRAKPKLILDGRLYVL
uniref:Nucleoside-diphosphate kinase n=1 Tax=Angiostrongylus cantonensis TaxID=6313 RepID=A0A0K0DF67_ANGCA